MPSFVNCSQEECVHNDDELCHASVIRVRAEGKGKNNTYCDTATDSNSAYRNTASEHMNYADQHAASDGLNFEIGESLEPGSNGPRVSCTVSNCSHNDSYVCKYHGSLDIKEARSRFSPVCADFTEV